MKRRWVRVGIKIYLVTVFPLLMLEGLLSGWAWWKYGTIDVARIHQLDGGNVYQTELERDGTSQLDTMSPHPYLAFTRNQNVDAAWRRWNNVGLIGRDFPVERNPSQFTILLLGGSVAQFLAQSGEGGRNYLEQYLNDRYDFGRPVVVVTGATGGWHQPQQAIMLMLYGEVADAVISIEGWNERLAIESGERFEMPTSTFVRVNPVLKSGSEALARAWLSNELKQFALQHNWRSTYFATRFVRGQLDEFDEQTDDEEVMRRMFALPPDADSQQSAQFNARQYEKYSRLTHALAKQYGLKACYFMQPVPAIKKVLTTDERRTVGELDYSERYQSLVDSQVALAADGIPVRSLLDLFAGTSETVYADSIHCTTGDFTTDFEINHRESKGYRIMSERIAAEVADAWDIPKR